MLLDDWIEKSGLKKGYVAQQVGINRNTLTKWIQGRSYPDLKQADKLAALFDCKVDDLYIREGKE